MITCKEDLFGTYIAVNSAEDAKLVQSVCENLGIKIADWEETKYDMDSKFALTGHKGESSHSEAMLFSPDHNDDEDTMLEFCNLSRLEISDLLPASYENTKVYSLDEDVIRKYAELCGVEVNHGTIPASGEYVGVSWVMDTPDDVARFTDDSDIELGIYPTTTLTPEQILAAWGLRFNQPSTETLQSALDKSQLKVMELTEQLAEAKGVKATRTKVEFVKCEFEHAWQAVKIIEGGEILFRDPGGNDAITIHEAVTRFITYGDFYRRTEVEIDWRDEAANLLECHRDEFDSWTSYFRNGEEGVLKFCHLVAELTDKPQ